MRTRVGRVLAACALCAATAAASAAVADPPVLRVEEGAILHGGQSVRVTWTALPAGAEEFELLLRCESPLSLTLRLTECEDPSLADLSWRVPELPCGRARLLLRFGDEGRESLWAQSEPFRIIPGSPAGTERVVLQDGELWLREGPAQAHDGLGAGALSVASAPGGTPCEAAIPPLAAGFQPPPVAPLARRAETPRPLPRPQESPNRPLNLPLRI